MQKITFSDFSGGIQEALSPDDFTARQWAKLYGVVPVDETTFQSQWPAQRIGNITEVNAVYPLEADGDTYLVAIKLDGTLWWCRVPSGSADYTAANTTQWANIPTSENKGFARSSSAFWFDPTVPATITQPDIPVEAVSEYRFLTGLPFEVYKYVKAPFNKRSWDLTQDYIPENVLNVQNKSTVSGVLIGCRRKFKTVSNVRSLGVFDQAGSIISAENHQVLVAYVDPIRQSVRVASFPNIRRWPTYKRTEAWPQTTDNEGATAGAEFSNLQVTPRYITRASATTSASPLGNIDDFALVYPFTSDNMLNYPNAKTVFHPFTYLTADSALLPGKGNIPRANVATMWGNQLVLGDIEWRSDKSTTATNETKVTIPGNSAYLGYGGLYDDNTEPHRGKLYYSQEDIDVFDPRSVVSVSSSDARIAGMFMLDNRLVCITTASGPNDGVIALSGNLGQLLSYSDATTANPFAIRRTLIRGGVGVADYDEDHIGHVGQACMWAETGTVVFIDASGGIFYTDGSTCDRLDRIGPKQPNNSTYRDHVAASGKSLFAWRNQRLLLLTVLSSGGDTASGCWTELVPPTPFGPIENPDDIRSMIGTSNQMFMVAQGAVFRYTMAGPNAEFGRIDNAEVAAVISTASVGNLANHEKTNWFRTGFSFTVPDSFATIVSIVTKGEAALITGSKPSYTVNTNEAYSSGHHDLVVPAGIGRQQVASATVTFRGNVILGSVTFWGNGGIMSRDRT